MIIRPDCADLPTLRAYFACKMGLPYGYSKCSRGGDGNPPKCVAWLSNRIRSGGGAGQCERPIAQGTASTGQSAAPPMRLGARARRSAAIFRSSPMPCIPARHGRRSADNNTDYYPVPLTEETLRPGTVYADPYGHVLMMVQRVAQTGRRCRRHSSRSMVSPTARSRASVSGAAISCSPRIPKLGGPGFKRFRPIVAAKSGGLRRLTNDEITKDSQYGDFSLEQSQLFDRSLLRPHG